MSDYIKFSCKCMGDEIILFDGLAELNSYRRKLVGLGLVGVYKNGIGFGNLSVRDAGSRNFYITGSGTGAVEELRLSHCAKVLAWDFERNRVWYHGSVRPSSESMTHAAIYASDPTATGIIHCHSSTLWAAILNDAPTTCKAVQYGTPEMAHEIKRLFTRSNAQTRKIIAMAGHEGGILTFGTDLGDAFAVLLRERATHESSS